MLSCAIKLWKVSLFLNKRFENIILLLIYYFSISDFKQFKFVPHKNSKKNNTPYVRKFPTTLEEAHQDRQMKKPSSILAETNFKSLTCKDPRMLPTKANIYNLTRRGGTKYVNYYLPTTPTTSKLGGILDLSTGGLSVEDSKLLLSMSGISDYSMLDLDDTNSPSTSSQSWTRTISKEESERLMTRILKIGDTTFHNNAHTIDMNVVFGLKESPQLLDCVPFVDPDLIQPGDVFTFYVKHENRNISKDIPVDCFGKWNMSKSSSKCKSYFYSASFEKCSSQAEAEYVISKYSSTNYSCIPMGSFIRRIWRGYRVTDREPFGVAIVSYMANPNFEKFHFEAHKNAKHKSEPYIRRFPSTIEEERASKTPADILAEAKMRTAENGEDLRRMPSKYTVYDTSRKINKKNKIPKGIPVELLKQFNIGQPGEENGDLPDDDNHLTSDAGEDSTQKEFDFNPQDIIKMGCISQKMLAWPNPPGDNFFHNNAHQIDASIIFGLSQPPQLLNCVPVIDTNQIEAGDIFTFYVNHTNEYVSKNIPVDSFGKWNMNRSSSKCKSYFYSATFEKVQTQAEAEYIISKYTSTNYSCIPLGSFIRRIWRGYRAQDRSPIGCAIVSYMANDDFERFHFEAHKNSRHNTEPYVRRFPTALEEAVQERQLKRPCEVMADASVRAHEHNDVRLLPTKSTLYNGKRRFTKRNDPEGATLSGDFSGNPESGYYEDDIVSFNRYMDQYEEDQSTNDSTPFDPSLIPLEEETPCTMTLEDILNQTGG
ncbi:hypothetical protein WR25_24777 isoform D [Diploscapter pachys]|uniref:Uncharacterized protein n=1 Tax=Diploscapter pachys TaxID=2018661 RepID=A0A2A2KWN7_9BILA|nr:hypothetical protein WR25_24777 isoform A [Diploscapter pachys]PAV78348.1 hypothetical protein WR25_24777 isoform B [Diploscapter pachys]PAV78349.1 hypothetical protein WR25_24777 isoform C [Diploscapter pachys]PAV78350.1 hypothetical protein WR25_24777 isoform D [Diploscapter pachys]